MPHQHTKSIFEMTDDEEIDWDCPQCCKEFEEDEKRSEKAMNEMYEFMAKQDPNYREGSDEDWEVEDGYRDRMRYYQERDYRIIGDRLIIDRRS